MFLAGRHRPDVLILQTESVPDLLHTQFMHVSTVITLTGTSTQEARQLLEQKEASGLEWEHPGCLDIFLVVREGF